MAFNKFACLALLSLATILPGSGKTCTCLNYQNDFFAGIYYLFSTTPNDSVHIVKAIRLDSVNGHGMRYRVLRYYCGNTFKDTIIVWGYAGTSCRITILANPGDTVILAMRKIGYKEGIDESLEDFSVSACGKYALLATRDSVFGGVFSTFAYNGYPLALFEDSLCKALGGICPSPLSVKPPDKLQVVRASIFPNPGNGNFDLVTENFSGPINITIISSTGALVKKGQFIQSVANHRYRLQLNGLPSGRYYARISSSGYSVAIPIDILY